MPGAFGGFALEGQHDAAHAEVGRVIFDGLLAVAAVGGDRPRRPTRTPGDPLDRRRQLGPVEWVADSTV